MKGRLSSILWRLVALNVVCIGAALALGYSAGVRSGGLSLLDFGALPAAAGLRLWLAMLALVVGVMALVWGATRVLTPLKSLADFAEELGRPDAPPLLRVESDDDFGFIGERLTQASEKLAAAEADQLALAALNERVAQLAGAAERMSYGDFSVRAAVGEDDLGHAGAALNTALIEVSSTLANGRDAAGRSAASAGDAVAALRATDNALLEHAVNAQRAAEALSELPPAIRQIKDNAVAITGAAQTSQSCGEQAQQASSAVAADAEKLSAELLADAAALAALRTAAERLEVRLRELSLVTERANVLALNAAVAAARAGEATRTPVAMVEEFRALAQNSSDASGELQRLVAAVRQHAENLLQTTEQQQAKTEEMHQRALAAARAAGDAAASAHEVVARGEVVGLAAGRQQDAQRALEPLLRALAELGVAAANHARRAQGAAERSRRLGEDGNQALGLLRTRPAPALPQALDNEAPPEASEAATVGK
jgi:methyl-accepting chemotaxis protein